MLSTKDCKFFTSLKKDFIILSSNVNHGVPMYNKGRLKKVSVTEVELRID